MAQRLMPDSERVCPFRPLTAPGSPVAAFGLTKRHPACGWGATSYVLAGCSHQGLAVLRCSCCSSQPADTRPVFRCPAVSGGWISITRDIFGLLHQPMRSLSSTSEVLQVFALQFGFKLRHEKAQNRSLKKTMYQSASSRGRPGLPAAGNAVTACGPGSWPCKLNSPNSRRSRPLHPDTQAPIHLSYFHRPICCTVKRGFSLLLKDSLNRNLNKKTFLSAHLWT